MGAAQPEVLEAQAPAHREEVVALLLEVVAERGLVSGGEGLLHHLARRSTDPADVFHRGRKPTGYFTSPALSLKIATTYRALATTRVASSSGGVPPDHPCTSPSSE